MRPRVRRRVTLRAVLGAFAVCGALTTQAQVFPANPDVFLETSGRESSPAGGDWYTTATSSSTDRIHRILIEITPEQLTACGGVCDILVLDAEATDGAGPADGVVGASDPTQFSLRDRTGVTILQGPVTVAGGSANGTTLTFTANAVGVFQLTSVIGAFPISGDPTIGLNDDNNAWRVQVEQAGGVTGGEVAILQSSIEHSSLLSLAYNLFFVVGPTATDLTLALRNFDLDAGATAVTYDDPPAGGAVGGTISGNGVWNGAGGSLNAGQDSVAADTAFPGGTDIGTWTIGITGYTNLNQTIFEASGGGQRFATTDTTPLRAGNFAFDAASAACGNDAQAVFQTFTVINHYLTNDIINLTASAAPAGWSAAQFQTSAGVALTDTDGDGQVDTGIMTPGQTLTLRVQTTPSGAGLAPYNATISGISLMDARVGLANTTRTVQKRFYVCVQVTKSFTPASVGINADATLTLTLTNRNTSALSALSFTDTYPASLINSTPLTVGGTCTGVTHTATAGGSTLNVTAGNVPAATLGGPSGSCTITIQVRSATAGAYDNSTSGASALVAGDAIGPGAVSSTATLTVLQRPAVSKSFAPDPIAPGGTSTLTITLTNPNAGTAITGVTATDIFPTSPGAMTVASPLTTSNTCGGTLDENDGVDADSTLEVEVGDGSIELTGGTIPAGGSCVFTVNVTAPAAGTYTNTIPVGGVTSANAGSNDAAASDTLTVVVPSLTVVKSSTAFSDPFNNTTDPKRIPGGFVVYSILVTNPSGLAIDTDTVIVIDPIPANTDLYVGDVAGPASGPVAFTDGTPSSGLAYSFVSLASALDDVSFSNDGGATFTYTPAPNGNGVDPAVTHLRINPKGSLAPDPVPGSPSPSFTVSFRVRVE